MNLDDISVKILESLKINNASELSLVFSNTLTESVVLCVNYASCLGGSENYLEITLEVGESVSILEKIENDHVLLSLSFNQMGSRLLDLTFFSRCFDDMHRLLFYSDFSIFESNNNLLSFMLFQILKSDAKLKTKVAALVKLAYKKIEGDFIFDLSYHDILLTIDEYISKLETDDIGYNVRTDPNHLTLSLYTVKLHVLILLADSFGIESFYSRFIDFIQSEKYSSSPVFTAGHYNIICVFSIFAYLFKRSSNLVRLEEVSSLALAHTKKVYLRFENNPQDRIFLWEFQISHTKLVKLLLISSSENDNVDGWFVNNANVNYEMLMRALSYDNFRVKSSRELLMNMLDELCLKS